MTTNIFRSILLSGTLGEEYVSGHLLGFMIINSANGYCLLLDFKQGTESMPYNELKLSWKEFFCSYMGLLSSPEMLLISFWKWLQQSKLDIVASHLV